MWSRTFIQSKLRALAIHLALSAVAFGAVLYFILVRWYPQPWFIDGGWQGVRIMVFVDLVLGPLLTFIIFDRSKSQRALAFDLAVIGITQLGAFAWGVYAVHGQRPVAISYDDGAFYSVEEKALRNQHRTAADLAQFDDRVPALVYTQEPHTYKDIAEVGRRLQQFEVANFEFLDLLQPLKPHLEEVWEKSDELAALVWADPSAAAKVQRLLEEHPGIKREDLRFAWFIGRYEDATLVMSKDGSVLGTVAYLDLPKRKKPHPHDEPARSAG